ncbi:ABC transporter permease [Pontibacter vulgaris]|uniref:ABC transporter permease n=1 Tax=Pontibacter vulgaris TaxID=2905679 RepID=UPI001FA71217|nr:ABC transporter permease [Pontibacter vulgaris]
MLKIYFLTALRSLLRNKSYSVLNIMGLALGITCSILLFLVIKYELSYDAFHTKADRIYRLNVDSNYEDGVFKTTSIHFPAVGILRSNNPGFEKITQLYGEEGGQITVPGNGKVAPRFFREEAGVGFVEPEYMDLFDFDTGGQDIRPLLREPNTIILTQSKADLYFPGEEAVGKTVKFNNTLTLKVAAVIPDFPTNTDFPFAYLISYASLKNYSPYDLTSWNSLVSNHTAFALLPEHSDVKAMEKNINTTLRKHMPEKRKANEVITLQPLDDIHFNADYGTYSQRTISKEVIWSMALVGLFLVITACINFINLATAQAIKRAKEVGIRKVMGSNQWQLMLQFLGETFIITLMATLISVILTELALPYLNQLLELKITFGIWNNPALQLFLALQIILVTLFAGLYPAFVLSRFQPITALRSRISVQQVAGISLRRALVVVQFTICQVLIICTFIVNEQMLYFRNKDLGFNKDAVVTSFLPQGQAIKLKALRHELLSNPAVENVTFGIAPPAGNITSLTNFGFNNSREDLPFQANLKFVDENYLDVFGLKLIAGRKFKDSENADANDSTLRVLINETMRRKLQLKSPEDALGKSITLSGGRTKGIILGVVEDFHQASLHDPIDPIFLVAQPQSYLYMMAKINVRHNKEALKHLEQVWYKAYPDDVFNYEFLDESIARFYQDEQRQSTLFKVFSFIAIFIGCLGLYGLISFMAAQRTKEIGIRKVMGASILNITILFSKEFVKLVLIAFLVAAPIAYYLMQLWLQDFTYRISIGYWAFILAGIATLVIALVTISFQAIKAALRNPIYSLKTE